MSVNLSGAVAVITGAGSGIGRGTADAFAGRGARVVVTDIDADRVTAVAAELGDNAVALRCDVTSTADLEAARDLALEHFGRVDVVMNNVGVVTVGWLEDVPIEAWQRMLDLNLLSVVRSNLVFVPLLRAQGSGHIVNTASIAGLFPYPYIPERLSYAATKYAVVGLSEAMAVYLRPKGIGVSCLCPAGVKTNGSQQTVFYGPRMELKGPGFAMIDADSCGELVADAVEANRFLIHTDTAPAIEMREHAADMDGYIDRVIEKLQKSDQA